MFGNLQMAPADPILGLTEAFKQDSNPDKVNLGVGVYKDESGKTPIFTAVKKAEERILAAESSKSYLPIPGPPEYAATVQDILFGRDHVIVTDKRAATAQTPGGTGALRIAGDLFKTIKSDATIWLSEPTWANHNAIFAAAGLQIQSYPYYDASKKGLAFDAMIDALKKVPAGDIVLFHACCHNPTGVDPTDVQWGQIAEVAQKQGFTILIDCAYQGFAEGLDQDVTGLRMLCETCPEVLVASSYSKNFGLYDERVGGLTIVCDTAERTEIVFSHTKVVIRRCYSNPPYHGGAIVSTVWNDDALRREWQTELDLVRSRVNNMRTLMVETLKAKGVARDFSFITSQYGMFSFSGLNKEQVDTLREKYAIYIVGSGRINVAGLTPGNMDRVCSAIADVL